MKSWHAYLISACILLVGAYVTFAVVLFLFAAMAWLSDGYYNG